MFIKGDRILQNFCWMPEAKWRFTTSEIKIMMDVYQTVSANTSPNYNVFWVILTLSKSKKNRLIRVLCIIQIKRFLECSEVPGGGMFKVS